MQKIVSIWAAIAATVTLSTLECGAPPGGGCFCSAASSRKFSGNDKSMAPWRLIISCCPCSPGGRNKNANCSEWRASVGRGWWVHQSIPFVLNSTPALPSWRAKPPHRCAAWCWAAPLVARALPAHRKEVSNQPPMLVSRKIHNIYMYMYVCMYDK